MKKIIYICISSVLLTTGCTTYPKQYTYSPTVTVGGDNQGGIVLPSPYAKKPQPVPQIVQQPVYQDTGYSSYDYEEESPLYITNNYPYNSGVRYQDANGNWY
jgi:hypothetical protein